MFKKVSILVVALMVCALSLSGAGTASAAEAWPKEKPFTMLIPFATGGGTDFNARLAHRASADVRLLDDLKFIGEFVTGLQRAVFDEFDNSLDDDRRLFC